jgi:hypothetical protein
MENPLLAVSDRALKLTDWKGKNTGSRFINFAMNSWLK